MGDLVAFLNARLDEDEALTVAWREHRDRVLPTLTGIAIYPWDSFRNPERMLREVEAKRKIVERCALVLDAFGREDGAWPDVTRRERAHADFTLCELVSVYSDHPDYRQDWA